MDSSRRADLGPSKWLKPLDDGWRERPGKDISEILAGKAKQKAACFLARGRRWTTFWSRRRESTADRRQLEKLALAVQDATTLNCDVLEATSGLDGLGGGGKGADGILALRCHRQRGRPLGLLGIDAGFRRAEPKNSVRRI